MLRKQLSAPSELPPEFDIDKYSPPAGASCWYWVSMLEARVLRRSMSTQAGFYKGELQDSCRHMFEDPQWPSKGWQTGEDGLRRNISSSHVAPFTMMDLYCLISDTKQEELSQYGDAWEVIDKSPEIEQIKAASALLNKPLHQAFEVIAPDYFDNTYVKVDLCGSEEKIVDDFKKWLREAQVAQGLTLPRRRIAQSDFDSWTRYQVLAYFDLTFWAKVNDLELTQNLIGLALFPNDFDVSLAERVRKTVAPLARSIFSEDFTDLLRAQALEAEQKESQSIPSKFQSVGMTEDGSFSLCPPSKT